MKSTKSNPMEFSRWNLSNFFPGIDITKITFSEEHTILESGLLITLKYIHFSIRRGINESEADFTLALDADGLLYKGRSYIEAFAAEFICKDWTSLPDYFYIAINLALQRIYTTIGRK